MEQRKPEEDWFSGAWASAQLFEQKGTCMFNEDRRNLEELCSSKFHDPKEVGA